MLNTSTYLTHTSDNHHQSQSRSKSPRGCSISNQSPMCNPHSLRHLGILGGTRQHCHCRPGARVIDHPDNYLKQSIDLIPGSDWYSVAQSCCFLAVQIASLCTSSTLKPVCINAHLVFICRQPACSDAPFWADVFKHGPVHHDFGLDFE